MFLNRHGSTIVTIDANVPNQNATSVATTLRNTQDSQYAALGVDSSSVAVTGNLITQQAISQF